MYISLYGRLTASRINSIILYNTFSINVHRRSGKALSGSMAFMGTKLVDLWGGVWGGVGAQKVRSSETVKPLGRHFIMKCNLTRGSAEIFIFELGALEKR